MPPLVVGANDSQVQLPGNYTKTTCVTDSLKKTYECAPEEWLQGHADSDSDSDDDEDAFSDDGCAHHGSADRGRERHAAGYAPEEAPPRLGSSYPISLLRADSNALGTYAGSSSSAARASASLATVPPFQLLNHTETSTN